MSLRLVRRSRVLPWRTVSRLEASALFSVSRKGDLCHSRIEEAEKSALFSVSRNGAASGGPPWRGGFLCVPAGPVRVVRAVHVY